MSEPPPKSENIRFRLDEPMRVGLTDALGDSGIPMSVVVRGLLDGYLRFVKQHKRRPEPPFEVSELK